MKLSSFMFGKGVSVKSPHHYEERGGHRHRVIGQLVKVFHASNTAGLQHIRAVPDAPRNTDDMGSWFTSSPEKAGALYGPHVYSADIDDGHLLSIEGEDYARLFGSNLPLVEKHLGKAAAAVLIKRLPDTLRKKELAKKRDAGTLTTAERLELGQLEASERIAVQAMKTPEYAADWRDMLRGAGYRGLVWRDSHIDCSLNEPPHDVYLLFNTDPIAVDGGELKKGGLFRKAQLDLFGGVSRETSGAPSKLKGHHRVGGSGPNHKGSHWDTATGTLFPETPVKQPMPVEVTLPNGRVVSAPPTPVKVVRDVVVPPAIERAMQEGAALAVSISGGKDSQALLEAICKTYRERGWKGELFAIHADLGKAEWPQTPAFVEKMCAEHDIPLTIVKRAKGGLVERMEERLQKVAEDAGVDAEPKPFWPSSTARYCTSHLKTGPIDQHLRQVANGEVNESVNKADADATDEAHAVVADVLEGNATEDGPQQEGAQPAPFWPSSSSRYCTSDLKRGPIDQHLRNSNLIISADGLRAAESPARAKKAVCQVRSQITASSKDAAKNLSEMSPLDALDAREDGQRVALDWRPIHEWSDEDVWAACGTSIPELKRRQFLYRMGETDKALDGWNSHPAYVFGNSRLSCVFCVLGSKNDLENGARHNPELLQEYVDMERRGKATFKNNFSLKQLDAYKELEANQSGFGKSVSASEPERWQWMANKEGGQTTGNQTQIVSLEEHHFTKEVAPRLREGFASNLAEYQEKTGDTHARLVRSHSGPWRFDGAGTPETLRPHQNALSNGWAKPVSSFDDPGAVAHGATFDSDPRRFAKSLFDGKPREESTLAKSVKTLDNLMFHGKLADFMFPKSLD